MHIERLLNGQVEELGTRHGDLPADADMAFVLMRLNDWAEAVCVTDSGIDVLKRANASGEVLSAALLGAARKAMWRGQLEAAGRYSEEALWLARIAYDSEHDAECLGEALRVRGAVLVALGSKAEAAAISAESCRMLRTLCEGDRYRHLLALAQAQHNLVGARLLNDDLSGAVSAAGVTLQYRRELAQLAPLACGFDLGLSLCEAAKVYFQAELFQLAMETASESVDVIGQQWRDGNADTAAMAAAHAVCAQCCLGVGDWESGLAATDAELALLRSLPHGRRLAEALHNRVTFCLARGELDAALRSVVEAIELAVRDPGATASARVVLGSSLHLAGRLSEYRDPLERTAAWYEQALRVRRRVASSRPDAVDSVAQSALELARVRAGAGRYQEAAAASEIAVAGFAGALGSGDDRHEEVVKYGRALLQAGNLRRRAGEIDVAIAHYVATAGLRERFTGAGEASVIAAAAVRKLIACLARAGRSGEADAWRERLADFERDALD